MLGIDVAIDALLSGYPAAWFSPTYKMLSDVWRDMSFALQPVTKRINAQEHRIELITGGVFDMWSLDTPDVARGRKYKRVVIDEAAMIHDCAQTWHAVIRPTLADYGGDAWFLSTPKGRNFFHTIYEWGQDETQSDWRAFRMTTYDNPYIERSEIEAMRSGLPERIFAQEIMAEFLESSGGVFRRVRECATAEPLNQAQPGGVYAGGMDFARSNDFTVLTLMDMRTKRQVVMDRFSQVDYETQIARFKGLHARFRPVTWLGEENSMGGPLVERLRAQGYPVQPFVTTNASKKEIIDSLVLGLEQGAITILNDETLIAELQAYEMTRLPSGMLRYSAPEGMHDDCVISLALAFAACNVLPDALPIAGGQRQIMQDYRSPTTPGRSPVAPGWGR